MIWARMLAYITGTVDQELLLRNEYLAAENRILRAQIKGRLLLSDAEKVALAEIGHRLGRKALEELSAVAKPDTLLAWYRKLIANKFDGSKFRKSRGRPRVDEETERLLVRMAKENPGWGYDRIVGEWPTWVTGSRIRRWAIFSAAMIFHRLPSGSRQRVGKTLSVLTWRYWWRPTSSRWKCLRSEDCLRTTCCFSFIWRVGGYAWPELRVIRIKSGSEGVGSSGRMTEATGNRRTSMRATDKPFNWRVCLMGAG